MYWVEARVAMFHPRRAPGDQISSEGSRREWEGSPPSLVNQNETSEMLPVRALQTHRSLGRLHSVSPIKTLQQHTLCKEGCVQLQESVVVE